MAYLDDYETQKLFSFNIKNELFREELQILPQKPGVYIFYNQSKEVIYVGKSVNLKQRVNSYYQKSINSKSRKVAGIFKDSAGGIFLKTPSELQSLFLEDELIKYFYPKYNKAGINWQDLYFLKLNNYNQKPTIQINNLPSIEEIDNICFSSRYQAFDTLLLLNKFFNMCIRENYDTLFCPYQNLCSCSMKREDYENALQFLHSAEQRVIFYNRESYKLLKQLKIIELNKLRVMFQGVDAALQKENVYQEVKKNIFIIEENTPGKKITYFLQKGWLVNKLGEQTLTTKKISPLYSNIVKNLEENKKLKKRYKMNVPDYLFFTKKYFLLENFKRKRQVKYYLVYDN